MISKHLISAKWFLWYFLYDLFILKITFIYLTIKVTKGKGARCVEYFTLKRPGGLCTPLDKILALLNREGNSSDQKGNFSQNMSMPSLLHVLQIKGECSCVWYAWTGGIDSSRRWMAINSSHCQHLSYEIFHSFLRSAKWSHNLVKVHEEIQGCRFRTN